MADDDLVFVSITATCHTDGCANADIPIVLSVPDGTNPFVVCGVCGQQITNIQPEV